jgi:hypothetical protein
MYGLFDENFIFKKFKIMKIRLLILMPLLNWKPSEL